MNPGTYFHRRSAASPTVRYVYTYTYKYNILVCLFSYVHNAHVVRRMEMKMEIVRSSTVALVRH